MRGQKGVPVSGGGSSSGEGRGQPGDTLNSLYYTNILMGGHDHMWNSSEHMRHFTAHQEGLKLEVQCRHRLSGCEIAESISRTLVPRCLLQQAFKLKISHTSG